MNQNQQSKNEALIRKAYAGFNERNIDAVLSLMQPEVHWPKGFDGGYADGHAAVRAYWTKQWTEINPHVEPITITPRADGKTEVEVNQQVKDLDGNILLDGKVKHIFLIIDDLVQQMEIESQ